MQTVLRTKCSGEKNKDVFFLLFFELKSNFLTNKKANIWRLKYKNFLNLMLSICGGSYCNHVIFFCLRKKS